MKEDQSSKWTDIIEPGADLFNLKLKEVWRYRDLLLMFVRRDFVATYKQTILGPLWFIIQPVLTTFTFILVFGRIAGISTDGQPMLIFYLSGLVLWNYFAECLNKTATVFRDNAPIFGKVYFPRLVMPLSIVLSNLVKLAIQLSLFIIIWIYYLYQGEVHPNFQGLLLFPLMLLIIGIIALGFGMIISALTTKYRDLVFLLTFGTQLLMYATPIIYPLAAINSNYKWIIKLNPLTPVIETFRYGFLGTGEASSNDLIYSGVFAVALVILGTFIFNKVERSFMDTV